jgi:hypothetical protein
MEDRMRYAMILVLVVLAGCAGGGGSQAVYRPPPELVAEYDRQMGPPPGMTAAQLAARDRQQRAEAICAARAEMAGATYSGRGFGLVGALTAGTEAAIAGERARTACLGAYQRTGVMPSF